MVIDFHTHTFPDTAAGRILSTLSRDGGIRPHTDGTRGGLSASMKKAGVDWSVNLPTLTRADQVEKINHTLVGEQELLRGMGIITFGGMHPDYHDVSGALRYLKENGIPGIKLHSAFQGIDLDDSRMMRVIEEASVLGLIVLIHGGLDIGFPDHNYATVPMIERVIREIAPPKLVVAHMGGWAFWQDVKQHLAGAPVYFDTAFTLDPDPKGPGPHHESLTEQAFLELVRAHGAERVLFGTDSPWDDQAAYVDALNAMEMTQPEREAIFCKNAQVLLGEDVFQYGQ